MPEENKNDVNLLDLLAFLLRWRKFLLSAVVSVAVVVGVISFLVTPKYRSTAIVKASESTSFSIGSLIASQISGIGGVGEMLPSFGSIPEEMFVSLLNSRWMSERVIETFELRKLYRMERSPIEDVIRTLETRTSFELDVDSRTLIISVDDRDPKRARDMAAFYVDELDTRNQSLKSSNARKEREFVARRLAEAQSCLASLEDSLSSFQLATGVLDPEEQVKATIQAAALLEAQRLATQTELEMSESIRGPLAAETAFLRIKLASIDSSFQSLIRGRRAESHTDFLLRFEDTPSQGMAFLRLKRDIEIQQLLVGFLLQQHEQAKLEEQRNTPTLMRLDPPSVASKRVWPRRGLMVVVAALSALVLGSLAALLTEFYRNASLDPANPQHRRILTLRRSWSGK